MMEGTSLLYLFTRHPRSHPAWQPSVKKRGFPVSGMPSGRGKCRWHFRGSLDSRGGCREDTRCLAGEPWLVGTVAPCLLCQHQACWYMLVIAEFLMTAKPSQLRGSRLLTSLLLCCRVSEAASRPTCAPSRAVPCAGGLPGSFRVPCFPSVHARRLLQLLNTEQCSMLRAGICISKERAVDFFFFPSWGEHGCCWGDLGTTLSTRRCSHF